MCRMAIGSGTPLGIAAGTWLAAYGAARRIGTVVRFVNDILLSAPSIVLGLFVSPLLVMQAGGTFSAGAGSVSLALDRKRVVVGQRGSVCVQHGGPRRHQKHTSTHPT